MHPVHVSVCVQGSFRLPWHISIGTRCADEGCYFPYFSCTHQRYMLNIYRWAVACRAISNKNGRAEGNKYYFYKLQCSGVKKKIEVIIIILYEIYRKCWSVTYPPIHAEQRRWVQQLLLGLLRLQKMRAKKYKLAALPHTHTHTNKLESKRYRGKYSRSILCARAWKSEYNNIRILHLKKAKVREMANKVRIK